MLLGLFGAMVMLVSAAIGDAIRRWEDSQSSGSSGGPAGSGSGGSGLGSGDYGLGPYRENDAGYGSYNLPPYHEDPEPLYRFDKVTGRLEHLQ
jgi:hypothetical protein